MLSYIMRSEKPRSGEVFATSSDLLYQCKTTLLIEAEWLIYASVQHANIASDNGLLSVRWQAIIWTNAAILSIRPKGIYFSEILFKIQKFSFKEMHLEASAKWRPFCLGLIVLSKSI